MKKLTKVISAVSLAAALTVGASAATLGDVNKDGAINSADALGVLQYSVGIENKGFDRENADVNGDGTINSSDALKILKVSVGLETIGKVPSTNADIASYFNSAVNKAVNSKAGFAKKRVTTLSNLDGGALLKMQVVVDTVNDFLGVGTTNVTNTKGKVGEISKASLTADDLSTATCTQSGDNYVINLTLKNGSSKANASSKSDSTALGRTGLYSGTGDKKAFDYKNAGNIYVGLNNAEGASVESVAEDNKNIKITATVNSKTGNLVSLHVDYDWHVNLTNVKYTVVKIAGASGDAKTTVDFTDFVF